MRGLHIFPTHGSWTQTDDVHVFSTDDNYRLTRAHREAVQYAEGETKPLWACDECFSIGTWCATCYQNTAHTFIGQKDDWRFHCKICDTSKGSL